MLVIINRIRMTESEKEFIAKSYEHEPVDIIGGHYLPSRINEHYGSKNTIEIELVPLITVEVPK